MEIHIIVSSHGLFAQEARNTAEMIIGHKQENVDVVSVTEGRSFDECLEEMSAKVDSSKEKYEGTLILTDIFGGTPSNIASHMVLIKENVQVYSGLSIPILLELLLTKPQTLAEAKTVVENAYANSLTDITKGLKEVNENANCIDSY
ncbi:hypothetical protein A4S06_09880 [Erysipelotrichaceae bacterium MTC7]|nr:hypothetical protein A4S06_09880 [Erysipelotrichaceae bacterium MTC7]